MNQGGKTRLNTFTAKKTGRDNAAYERETRMILKGERMEKWGLLFSMISLGLQIVNVPESHVIVASTHTHNVLLATYHGGETPAVIVREMERVQKGAVEAVREARQDLLLTFRSRSSGSTTLRWPASPATPASELGTAVRTALPVPNTMFMTMLAGSVGYILSDASYAQPGHGVAGSPSWPLN